MMTRLVWVLLVVCVFAGCGGPKPRTLENLTYYELTLLHQAELQMTDKNIEVLGFDEFRKEFGEATDRRTFLIRDLRKKAFEREFPNADKVR